MRLNEQVSGANKNVCRFTNWIQGTRQELNKHLCIRKECIGKDCINYKPYLVCLEETVIKAQEGDLSSTEKLIKWFKPYVFQMEKRYYIPGSEKEDLFQEGFLGLVTAIKTFKPDGKLNFRDFVSLSIRNSVIRAIRTATQKKRLILNQAKSIFDKSVLNMRALDSDPEEIAIKAVAAEQIYRIIEKKLTERESEMLKMKFTGYTAQEIADRFSTDKKVIDNALFRARQKVRRLIKKGVFSLGQRLQTRHRTMAVAVN